MSGYERVGGRSRTVELLAQDRVRVDRVRHLRIGAMANRPEDPAVKCLERRHRLGRQRVAVGLERSRANGYWMPVDRHAMQIGSGAADFDGGGHNLAADVVSVEDTDAQRSGGCHIELDREARVYWRSAEPLAVGNRVTDRRNLDA